MPVEIPNAILTSGRSAEMVAPEGVSFTPDFDLVGAAFGMSAPAGTYDPRLHDLRYIWSFGDPGVFIAPVNILPGHEDRNSAIGFFTKHVFRAPGTYTVRLDVYGTVGGAPVEAYSTRTVTIGDPDTIFAGARTFFVSPTSDWTLAPSGAERFTSLNTAVQRANEDGMGPYRVMLNRGESYTWGGRRLGFNSEHTSTVHVVPGPGAGALPALTCTGGFGAGANYDSFFVDKSVVFQGLRMTGPYDPVTPGDPWVADAFSFWGPYSPRQILLDRCEMRGFGHGVLIADSAPRHIYLNDCVIEDYAQWGLFGWHYSSLGVMGTRIQGHVDASINNDANMGGTFRVRAGAMDTVIYAGDFACRQGWSALGDGYIAVQPCIRIEADGTEGMRACVTRSTLEGGWAMMSISRGEDPSVVLNALVDDVYYLGGYQTGNMNSVTCGGVSVHNCTAVVPATAQRIGPALGAFVDLGHNGTGDVLAAPIRVHANIVVNFTAGTLALVANSPGYSNVVTADNIVHQPNTSPAQLSPVPLTMAPPLWTPRERGYRSTTADLRATTATPAGVAASYAPQAGGAAIEGGLAGALASATLSASGRLSLSASASAILAGATASATGAARIAGSAAPALAPAVLAGAAGLRITGTGARTLAPAGLAGVGRLRIAGAAGAALDAAALAGAGALAAMPGSGALGAALAPAGLSAAGRLSSTGSAAATLAGAGASAASGLRTAGSAAATLAAATVAAAGTLAVLAGSGVVGGALAPAALSSSGRLHLTGSVAAILAAASVAGAGALRGAGGAVVTLEDAAIAARQAAVVGAGGAAVTLEPAGLSAELWRHRRPTRTRGRRRPRASDARG